MDGKIIVAGETGRMYEANVDDVGYRLVAVYTPVREDGAEGEPVSASTEPITIGTILSLSSSLPVALTLPLALSLSTLYMDFSPSPFSLHLSPPLTFSSSLYLLHTQARRHTAVHAHAL